MLKSDWEEGLKRLEAILVDAKDTQEKSLKDIEELEFTIDNYKERISDLPDDEEIKKADSS